MDERFQRLAELVGRILADRWHRAHSISVESAGEGAVEYDNGDSEAENDPDSKEISRDTRG